MDKEYNYMVCVDCMTYNQASYIKDTFNGFCIQETNFPFVCTIIDDASTDGEQEVIKKYLQEQFDLSDKSVVRNEETEEFSITFVQHKTNKNCFFAVLYLKSNHYSIRKPKYPYVKEWRNNCKYISICEGDDYWTDPLKLQKQVDYMESNSECTLVCNRTRLFSDLQKRFIGESYCYHQSQDIDVRDIICRGGLFIATCSILYRKSIMNNYPEYCRQCDVGDYPLQIYAAMKGNVYYFNDIMSVYRVDNSASWMGRQQWNAVSDIRLNGIRSRVQLFKGFSTDFPSYSKVFDNKIAQYINRLMPNWRCPSKDREKYLDYFADEIDAYTFRWKIDLFIKKMRIPKIYNWYSKVFLRSYSQPYIKY